MLFVIIDALNLAPLLVALPCVTCIVTSFPAQLGRLAYHRCAIHDAAFATACPVLIEINTECAIVFIFFHDFILLWNQKADSNGFVQFPESFSVFAGQRADAHFMNGREREPAFVHDVYHLRNAVRKHVMTHDHTVTTVCHKVERAHPA